MTRGILILTALLGVSACGEHKAPASRPKASAPTPMTVTRAPTRPTAPGLPVSAVAPDDLQEAASVSQFHAMPRLNAKVFSVSGGDPAVNGLVTYLGLFAGPADGWRVYPLGDFAAWKVVEARQGRIVIETREEVAGAGDEIVRRTGHVHVDYGWSGGAPPNTVSVARTD